MNFRIMITAVIKSFGQSATDKRIEESSNEALCFQLYSILTKCFKDRMIWTK